MSEIITYNYEKYLLQVPKDCYFPSEDTFLLLNTLKKEITKIYNNVLEIGFGSGIISLFLYDFSKNIDCFDINPKAITYLKEVKQKYDLVNMNVCLSNLFEKANKKYDLIVFNPPYVPSEEIDLNNLSSLATDGGKDGAEIIIKVINNLSNYLNDNGVCYLLISSLNNIKSIKQKIEKNKLIVDIIINQKLFFEELFILKIQKCE